MDSCSTKVISSDILELPLNIETCDCIGYFDIAVFFFLRFSTSI